jgi:small conductance mechanosensitive channel
MFNVEETIKRLVDLATEYTPKVLLALLALLIGLRLIKGVTKLVDKGMKKREADDTLRTFLTNLLNWSLKAMLFISAASMVGIETTSFVAVLGAASLAVGLALQGSLSNFAGGVLLLIFRPYRVGDLIQAQGHLGYVKEIQIFFTTLATLDNKMVIVPNGVISNGDITNLSTLGKVRVELVIRIAYDADIEKAKSVLLEVMNKHPKVVKEAPFAPFVGVLELSESAVILAVRPHTHADTFWDVYFDVYEQGKLALDKAGVRMPFPQLDLHVRNMPK